MKSWALLLVISLFQAPAPSEKIKFAPNPKVGDSQSMKAKMEINFRSRTVDITTRPTTKVVSVDGDLVKTEIALGDVKMDVSGVDLSSSAQVTPMLVAQKTSGELISFEGGIAGADSARIYLLTRFVPPSSEIATGGSYTIDFKTSNDKKLPSQHIEGTFLGSEKIDAQDLFKFKIKYSEPEIKNGMTADLTFWVDSDGRALKLDGKFDKMPVPQLGIDGSGTIKAERVK